MVWLRRPALVPYGDVEDVAADRAGHGHVAQALPGHDDAGDEVGDGRPRGQDGQPHDLLRDAHRLAHLRVGTAQLPR